MKNAFVDDLLDKADEAVLDAQGSLDDGDTDEVVAAIEEAIASLNSAKRAIEDGIVPEDDLP